MIWGNFSIFRTNCAIACGTRAHMLRGFLRMSRRGNDVRNHRNVWCFWPTTAHNSIRSCLLEFCSSIFVVGCSSLSEVRQCRIYLCRALFISDQVMFRCFFYKRSALLDSKFHIWWKNNSFSWIYLDTTAFQDFKVSLLLPHACEEFTRLYHDRKVKTIMSLNCKFEFRLNCKQPLMFQQGTVNDNKFMSVDASQFCLCRNPTSCLLSINKSAHRCMFCNESVKHDKSVGLTHSRVKTDIELIISLVFSAWERIKSVAENMWIRQKKSAKVTTTLSLIWIGFIYSKNDFYFVGWIGAI